MTMNAALRLTVDDVRQRVSKEEWEVRVKLAACYRLVAHYGWDDLVYTHISARVPGPHHHFLINPYGVMFEEVTASSLVKVDIDGNVVLDNGYAINPAGYTIHSAIHAARENAGCVLHLHTNAGVAVSAQKHGLLPITQTAMIFTNQIAFHEYEGIALNLDERERLVADLGDKDVMLLRNHGTLTVGRDVPGAFTRMFFFERACQMQIAALSAGYDRISFPPQAAIDTVEEQGKRGMDKAGQLEWPALLRKLDRIDPSYRD
jgi:ribulose-5-phosphate 4-epimerase/fuculose-1-phosphate aldolase